MMIGVMMIMMTDSDLYSAGYTEGHKLGYADGFHDCLICMMREHHDLLKSIMDKEKEYSYLIEQYSSGEVSYSDHTTVDYNSTGYGRQNYVTGDMK